MFPLPRPTRKYWPDQKYFFANTEIFWCDKAWDENARKHFFLCTNMIEFFFSVQMEMFHCLYNKLDKDTHCVFWYSTKLLF